MSLAKEFPYQYHLEVVFRDLDAMGHVNNAVYFTYLETARLRYLKELLSLPDLLQIPVIMAEATCSYKSPAFYGENLVIGLGISRFGTKSFVMTYQVETDRGRVVATAQTVQVMYDYAAGQTIPVPDWFKEQVAVRQGNWQPGTPTR
ncbi:MAG: acyl-CoA thioesterase [Chloroflexi bacterium]|nr:acyl-CoA thioesterase [Chloroflexota bacterium]